MKRFLKRSAFTIVEMVIVIAVIGILATVMVPTISGMIEEANKSADTQFAASLTIQLAMHSVNGGINSEEDLREAFKEFYDEDYYDTKLVPKAAKSGYHFWYNALNGSVTAGTYQDIVDMAGPETAGPARGDFNFETSNPRTVVTANGNCFFLMDQGGDFVNAIFKGLDQMTDLGTYAGILDMLQAPDFNEADNALCAQLFTELKGFAIVNDAGTFAQKGETISHIYIPSSASELGDKTMLYGEGSFSLGAQQLTIKVPTGVKVGSYSMNGYLLVEGADNPGKIGSSELHMNIEESQLKDFFGSEATNCVIVLANGNRYIQVEGGFQRLTETGAEDVAGQETEYSQKLDQFNLDIKDGNIVDEKTKADLHFAASAAPADKNILHIVKGFTGTITLEANNFKEKDTGNAIALNKVVWMKDEEVLGSEPQLVLNISDFSTGYDITVKAQDKVYTLSLVPAGVDRVYFTTFDGAEISGTSYEGTGDAAIPVLTLNYTASKISWSLPVSYEKTCDFLSISTDVSVTDTYLAYSSGSLSLINTDMSGDVLNHYITVQCGNAAKQCKVSLIDNKNPVFSVNNDKYQLTTYKHFNYVFGTTGSFNKITLGDLFTGNAALMENQTISYKYATEADSAYRTLTASNWASTEIDLTAFSDTTETDDIITVQIKCRGQVVSASFEIAKGAKNISDVSGWANTNGTNLVLHTDLKNFADGAGMITVESATLYGNLHKISWDDGTYKVFKQADNAIITLNNGTVDNLIIEGPRYNTFAWWSNNTAAKDAAKGGMYVAGIYVKGNSTISNSYISGFRNPIATKTSGTTVNVVSSTLKGGAAGNIYVNEASVTLNISNSTLIQFFESDISMIGAGIYLDSKATSTSISITNSELYTYCSESNAKKLPAIADTSFFAGTVVSTLKSQIGTHTVGSSTEMHIGILMHASATVSGWSSGSNVTVNNQSYRYFAAKVSSYGAQICALKGGDGCSSSAPHTATPSWGYSATQYLTHRAQQ